MLSAYRPRPLSIRIDSRPYTTPSASTYDYWRTVVQQDADVLASIPAGGKSQARDDMRRAHALVIRLHIKSGLLAPAVPQ